MKYFSPLVQMSLLQAAIGSILWAICPPSLIPKLGACWDAFKYLWYHEDMFVQFGRSVYLVSISFTISLILALIFSYSTALPKVGKIDVGMAFRPLVGLIANLRMVSPIGVGFLVQVWTPNMDWAKVTLMCFSIVPWLVKSFCDIIRTTPEDMMDYAATLKYNSWRAIWEVKFLGNLDQLYVIVIQVFGMGWMMLTVIEKLARSSGGLGILLADQERFLILPRIFAIQAFLIVCGLAFDRLAWISRRWLFSWAEGI
jgi:NitT/TauT family transport system permease protein